MMYRIALSMRALEAPDTGEARSALAMDWIHWLEAADMTPVLIPNGLRDPVSFLEAMTPDLIVLTGGGERGQSAERDQVEESLFQHAIETSAPLLGVCRGLQVINELAGGNLQVVSGHTAVIHDVHFDPAWHRIYGTHATVNSYHDLGVSADALADNFVAAATDDAGNVEAAYHRTLPIAGVMWHPERGGAPEADRNLFETLIRDGAFWR